jgi:alkanesulfonate monooxygenase SsuD/methylene tetrahydromethanopterin reductase-like flavin-dependent oxidoreductase (luciferase family)
MQAWHFTEMPYPHASTGGNLESMRVTIPSRLYDPKIGSDLYNRYLDEHRDRRRARPQHHAQRASPDRDLPRRGGAADGGDPGAADTRTRASAFSAIPIANRGDPIRIAEEMAIIDNISRGRLDVGIVRGVPYEIFAANTNPTQTLERLWEGVDLIVKAWTSHDGPFNFEGRFTHRRLVNVWPRPYQQPHPMIWITGSSDYDNIKKVASRGYVFATFLQPHDKVKLMFDAYRSTMAEHGLPGGAGMAFMPLVYTADSEEEAEKGAKELTWYMQTKTSPQFRNPPGYVGVDVNVKALQGAYTGRTDAVRAKGMDYLREQGVLMYGTPDSVPSR